MTAERIHDVTSIRGTARKLPDGLCRKVGFERENPKIVCRKINGLRVQTFLFSVICDRAVVAPGCVPLFLTDGLKDYATALLTHFGQRMQPERRQERVSMPKPRWIPRPELLYAQVVKSYRRRRLVGVTPRVVFGTRLASEQHV